MIGEPTRRQVFFGGLLTVIWTAGCPGTCWAQDSGAPGCGIPREEVKAYFSRATSLQVFATGEEALEPRSGDPQLDRAFARSLSRLARTFEVLPGFAYYNDSNQPNARATPEARLDKVDGTVMFGHTLLRMLLQRPERDAAVLAVLAHEFGHIVSYKNGMIRQLDPSGGYQPFRAEQYADFISGFFAGVRKLENPSFPALAFASTQRSAGGVVRGSHGTGAEREAAVTSGFDAAFNRRLTPQQGKQAAFEYAMSRT